MVIRHKGQISSIFKLHLTWRKEQMHWSTGLLTMFVLLGQSNMLVEGRGEKIQIVERERTLSCDVLPMVFAMFFMLLLLVLVSSNISSPLNCFQKQNFLNKVLSTSSTYRICIMALKWCTDSWSFQYHFYSLLPMILLPCTPLASSLIVHERFEHVILFSF